MRRVPMKKDQMEEQEGGAKQEDNVGDHHQQENILTANLMNQPRTTAAPPPGGGSSSSTSRSTTSSQWSAFRNPRIVRVSRTFGGKDRHSKVCTVRGLRDRRIRLSVPTAIQLYDLQDRLGLGQPSKVIDWLIENTSDDIDKLPPLQLPHSFGFEAASGGGGHLHQYYNSSLAHMAPFFDFGRPGTSTSTNTSASSSSGTSGLFDQQHLNSLYQWGDHHHNQNHYQNQLPILGLGNNYGHDHNHVSSSSGGGGGGGGANFFLPSSYLALSNNTTNSASTSTTNSPHDQPTTMLMPPPPQPYSAYNNQLEMMSDNHHQNYERQQQQLHFQNATTTRPTPHFPFNIFNANNDHDDHGGGSSGS